MPFHLCGSSGLLPVLAGASLAVALPLLSKAAGALPAFTLEEAIATAFKADPELRAAGLRIEAALGRADQAGAWPNPELELATEEGPTSRGHVIADAKQTIGISQPILFPGKRRTERHTGLAGARAAEAEQALRAAELRREVKQAFYRVLAAERLAAESRELMKFADLSARTARKRAEAGAATEQEQLRAELSFEEARVGFAESERSTKLARQELAALLGTAGQSEAVAVGALPETDSRSIPAGPPTELGEHPRLTAARANRTRAEMELKRARLEPYPDVRLGVAAGSAAEPDRHGILELRLALPLPIFDRNTGRKREAQANVGVAEAEAAMIERQLRREWLQASARLGAATEQVAAYREHIVPKATAALGLVRRGFEEGKFGLIDLLDTQRSAAEARVGYTRALLNLNLARAELEYLLPESDFPSSPNTNSK